MAPHNILLVDDDYHLLSGLRVYLEANAFRVIYTSDPEDAIRILADNDIDVLIMDLEITDANGDALIDRLAQLPASLQPPSAILSSHDEGFGNANLDDRCSDVHELIEAIHDCIAVPS